MRRNLTVGPDAEGRYRCSMCNEWKPAEGFHVNRASKLGFSTRCRDCHAAYVRTASRRAANRAYEARRRIERRTERQAIIDRLRDRPCFDCDGTFPSYVMEFDHRDPSVKAYGIISLLSNGTLAALMAEVAKCDVVCANCHRIRTHTQRQSGMFRYPGRPRKADGEH
jgi:hypothetical protein